MNQTINTSILIQNMRDMEEHPTREFPSFLSDMGDGVQYLFTTLLSPLMNGHVVCSTQLDMERFTLGDIQNLYDLCENELDALFPAQKMLRKLYQFLIDTPPKNTSVAFL